MIYDALTFCARGSAVVVVNDAFLKASWAEGHSGGAHGITCFVDAGGGGCGDGLAVIKVHNKASKQNNEMSFV